MARVLAYSESGTDVGTEMASVVDDMRTRVLSSDSTESQNRPGWVSMTTTMFLVSALFIAISGVTAYVLSDGTMGRALDSTKSSRDKIEENMLNNLQEANRVSIQRTLEAFADNLELNTRSFLGDYVDMVRMMHFYVNSQPAASLFDWTWMEGQSQLLWSIHKAHQLQGFGGIGIVNNQDMMYLIMEEVDPYSAHSRDLLTRAIISNGNGSTHASVAMEYSGKLLPERIIALNVTVSSLVMVEIGKQLTANATIWTPITGQGSYFGNMLVRTITDDKGTWLGSVFVISDLRIISDFLKHSLHSLDNSTHGRAWTVAQSQFPNFDRLSVNKEPKLLTGVSHGEGTAKKEEYDPIFNRIENVTLPLNDQNATDSVIRNIALLIDGNYLQYSVLSLNYVENVAVYIKSKRLVDMNPDNALWMGTDWWITYSVEREFYTSSVDSLLQNSTEQRIAADNEVDDKIKSDQRLLIIVIAAIMLILSIGCFVLSVYITSPITALKDDMRHVANMHLEQVRDNSNLSTFKEVAAMQDSFIRMIQKLKEFRSFVPASLLVRGEVIGGAAAEPPTGDNITFVFTDIQGSTALWAHSQEAMNAAMDIHNETMRTSIHFYSGYEVKTIGDAFMVVFEDCINAIAFCLSVQRELLDQTWPKGLGLDLIESSGKPLWNGLRIRMGVHCGNAIVEENPITARTDYRGENVAKASRAEGVAKGGTVCITDTLLEVIGPRLGELDHPTVMDIGGKQLKGIEGNTILHLLTPRTLSDRLKDDGMQVQVATHSPATRASHGLKHMELKLENKMLTIGVVKVWPNSNLMSSLNQVIRFATDLGNETGGVVSMVWGTEVLVSWNSQSSRHVMNASTFAVNLVRKIRSAITVGIVTGKTLHGNVGTSKRRFHAIVGRNLRIASSLADYANGLNMQILVADTTPEKKGMESDPVRDVVRIVDRWDFTTQNARVVVSVYEVLAPVLQQLIDGVEWVGLGGNGVEKRLAKGVAYTSAFHKALKGDLQDFEKLREQYSTDVTLAYIYALLCHASFDVSGTRAVSFSTLPNFSDSSVQHHLFGTEITPNGADQSTMQPDMSFQADSVPMYGSASASDINSQSSPMRETSSNF